MATKNWNNDFMAKVLKEAAWKELSSEFAWSSWKNIKTIFLHPLYSVPAYEIS